MIEKSKILEDLKGEYAENQLVSERTINAALETMMRYVTEDTKEDEFLKDVKSFLKEVEGNARKVAADTAKKVEAKKKPTLKDDPKPGDSVGEPKEKEEENPAWLDKLLAKLDSYDARFAEEDRKKTAEKVKAEALAKVKIYPQNVVDVAVDDFDFSQEGATEKFVEKVTRTAGKFGITPLKSETKEIKPDFSKLRKELESNDELLK